MAEERPTEDGQSEERSAVVEDRYVPTPLWRDRSDEPADSCQPRAPSEATRPSEDMFYQKDSGKGEDTGYQYEIKMVLLTFLRCLANGGSFRLASNMKGAGKLDDIVFKQEGKPGWTCVQVKHRNQPIRPSEMLSFSDKFSVLLYFISYRDEMNSALVENCALAFYTNTSLPEGIGCVNTKKEFLTTSDNGCSVTFSKEDVDMYNITTLIQDYKTFLEDLDKNIATLAKNSVAGYIKTAISKLDSLKQKPPFHNKFQILDKKPTRENVQKLLEEVKKLGDFSQFHVFLSKFVLHCKQATERELTPVLEQELSQLLRVKNCASILKQALESTREWWLCKKPDFLHERHRIWIDIIRNAFQNISASKLSEISHYNLKFRSSVVNLKDQISDARLLQVFVDGDCTALAVCKVHQVLESEAGSPPIFVSLQASLADRDSLFGAWGSRWGRVLVIEAEQKGVEIGDLFSSLAEILRESEQKTLVVITNVNDLKTTKQVRDVGADKYVEWWDKTTLQELTDGTQNTLLERTVLFQNHKLTLRELVGKAQKLYTYIDEEILMQLLRGEFINFGGYLPELIYYYIPRTISCRETSLFKKNIEDLDNRVLIVTGEPGMGKSTLLTHLAGYIKGKEPCTWVVRFNVSEFTSYLDSIAKHRTANNSALDFLRAVVLADGVKCTLLEKNLFEHCWQDRGRMALLMDGYDEVCPAYESEINSIISDLLQTGISRLSVTSRDVCKKAIRDVTECVPFSLDSFTEQDQRLFLQKLWSQKNPDVDTSELLQFIDKVLSLVGKTLGDKEKTFTAIPLQTLFIADKYEESLRYFTQAKNNDLIFHIDIIELYEDFFLKKCEINFREKRRVDISNTDITVDFREYVKKVEYIHKSCSLVALLSSNDVESLHDKNITETVSEFIQGVKVGNDLIGVINDQIDGIPLFIHRTFAEFFMASWLAENYGVNEFVIRKLFARPNMYKVWELLNRILSKECILHTSVINGDAEVLMELLLTEDVNLRDAGGRTALHLAAGFVADDTLTRTLLEQGADAELVDDVLHWNALQYAEAAGKWREVELMLQGNVDPAGLTLTVGNIKNDKYIAAVIRESCCHVYESLLTFLLREGASPSMALDSEHNGPLHVVCNSDELTCDSEIVYTIDVLLRYGADINAQNDLGKTPLHLLSVTGNTPLVQYLLERNMDESAVEERSGTERLLNVLSGGSDKVMFQRVMTQYRDNEGRTAQESAAQRGMVELATYLENTPAALDGSLRQCDKDTDNPLLVSTVRFLVEERRADVDSADHSGNTPLQLAVKLKDEHVVEYLISQGADVNVRDQFGDTVLHSAAYNGVCNVVVYLIENRKLHSTEVGGHGMTVLHRACMGGHVNVVRYLLAKGAEKDAPDKNGDTALHQAARSGALDVLKSLVEEYDMSPNGLGAGSQMPLHVACECGHLQMIQYLTVKGANTEARNMHGDTPLHSACQHGRLNVVEYLVNVFGVNIEAANNDNFTPFHAAFLSEHLKIVQYLITKGAKTDVPKTILIQSQHAKGTEDNLKSPDSSPGSVQQNTDVLDQAKSTPLHVACKEGYFEVVEYLIQNSAETGAHNEFGNTPLHCATMGGQVNIVRYLLDECGEDIHARNKIDSTPLHIACERGHLVIVQCLLEKGARKEVRNQYGNNPLHCAAFGGKVNVVAYLLETCGEDIEARNKVHSTPVHIACVKGHLPVVQYLLERGADINARNEYGNLPVHCAVYGSSRAVLEYLLDVWDQDIEARNSNELTPLHVACEKGPLDVIIYLLEKGADRNARTKLHNGILHFAAFGGILDIFEYILDVCGEDIDMRNKKNSTPLHIICEEGYLEVMKYLLDKGANIKARNEEGQTPLHCAAFAGKLNIVEYLFEICGEDIDARNEKNSTPLHLACEQGHLAVLQYLLGKGADMNARNKYGNMALHCAAFGGKQNIAKYLLDICGEDIETHNKTASTPLHIASERGHLELVQYLLQKGADIDAVNEHGNTALHCAAWGGKLNVVEYLLTVCKQDIDARGTKDSTPLHLATEQGHLEVMQYLLEKGADKDGHTPKRDTLDAVDRSLEVTQSTSQHSLE